MARIQGIVKLRKLTGLPFKLCKDVFDKHGGDIPTSMEYLKKKCGEQFEPMDKSLNNGVVFTYSNNSIFGLFSIKCVTDFAARSQAIHEASSKVGSILCKTCQNLIDGKICHYKKEDLLDRNELNEVVKMASLALKEQTYLSNSFIIRNTNDIIEKDGVIKQIVGTYVHGSHDFRVMDKGKLGTGGAIIDLECKFKQVGIDINIIQQIADEIAIHLYSVKNISKDLIKDVFQLPIIRGDKFKWFYSQISGSSIQNIKNKSEVTLSEFIGIMSDLGIKFSLNNGGLLDLKGANLYDFRVANSQSG